MDKKNWAKELFRPENKKARINLFTAFLIGVLLLLMSHILIEPAPQPEAEMQIEQKNKEEKESSIEKELEKLSDDELKAKTDYFKKELKEGKSLDDILPEALLLHLQQ